MPTYENEVILTKLYSTIWRYNWTLTNSVTIPVRLFTFTLFSKKKPQDLSKNSIKQETCVSFRLFSLCLQCTSLQ